MRKFLTRFAFLAMALVLVLSACAPATTEVPATQAPATQAPATEAPATEAPTATEAPAEPFTFGILLVGAHNDQGWSQAHYDAGLYVEKNLPNSKMLYLENVYSEVGS